MARGALRRVGDRIEVAFEEVEAFLASPGGRRLRKVLAGGLLVTAPLVFRIPGLRRYPLVRTLELAGGAVLVVKFAEALRDWEPNDRAAVVIDVPPASVR
jgi:hypothetical protein